MSQSHLDHDNIPVAIEDILSDPERIIAIEAIYAMKQSQESPLWSEYLDTVLEDGDGTDNSVNPQFDNIRRGLEFLIRDGMMKKQLA